MFNIKDKLFDRNTWESGIAELKDYLGDDPYSMKMLLEQMILICDYSYDEYINRGISLDIFADTFGFINRFVAPTKDSNGKYRYDWAWWLQRQITLQEFRIGSLEYEFVDEVIEDKTFSGFSLVIYNFLFGLFFWKLL